MSGGMWEMERRYSMAEERGLPPPSLGMMPSTSEDLHAWSIYRQNLNSDFTDSALGSSEKSPLPYGNFQLRESTVQSILNHPRYGPKSALGSNMYTYLKFGLPRVLPPQGRKGTSSGYDSSDEGTRKRRHSYLAPQDVLHYQPGISARGKSISQANLLSPDTLIRQAQASHRRSLHDLRHTDYIHQNVVQPPLTRPASVAMGPSVPVPQTEPFSFSMLRPQQYTGLYPHLQIRNMNIRGRRGEPLVNNLSLEVKAGEILALMSTSGDVATAVLEVMAGRKAYSGQMSLNGCAVGGGDLRNTVALVRSSHALHPHLPVHSTLRFYAELRRPHRSRGKIPMDEQVRIVTEELGLGPVLDAKVSELTASEKNRLSVAVQLLADPQILCIDQLTHTMDIFDTFFLVEFLRHWASGATGGVTGRIVVMCLQPPTYEILTMVSRLVVLSGGETMYHGPARQITHYFTSADYPCPAFKNPADYYLDLVTLDDLSAEAMLESSQRVDQLAGLYRRRQLPLTDSQPYTLPPKFSTAGLFTQAYVLLMREAAYSQPGSFCRWISRVLLAAFLSVLIGAVFWDVPASDPQLYRKDRLGYHYAVMAVGSWPLLVLLGFSKTHGPLRHSAESDIQDRLYGRFVYVVCSVLVGLLPSALVWTAYLLPGYCMSGLYDQKSADGLTVYLGYCVATLLSTQLLVSSLGYLVPPSRLASLLLSTAVWILLGAASGYPIHRGDLPRALHLLGLATPLPWTYPYLQAREHSKETLASLNAHLVCRNKQVQHQDIIVQVPCPVPNGTAVLEHHGLLGGPLPPLGGPLGPALIVASASAVISAALFMITPIYYKHKPRQR